MCTLSSLVMAVTAPSCVPSVPAQSPLPLQQIPRAISAKIEDNEGKLIAVGALVRYSTNQAYFILQHLDKVLKEKAVTIYTPDEVSPLNFRIDSIHDSLPDRTFMPMYIQVHHNPKERLVIEHLIDNLAETTLGRANLELKKNVTIDIFDSDGDKFLRDNAGFIVTDRLQFHQITVDAQQALTLLTSESKIEIEEIQDKALYQDLVQYDNTLSPHNRSEFLDFLFLKSKVYAARWKNLPNESKVEKNNETETQQKFNEIAGYISISRTDQRVFCLYADSDTIAEALLAHHLKQSRAKNAILCTTRNYWTKLQSLTSCKSRVIYRRHTRLVPKNIKWSNIYAINIGINIF